MIASMWISASGMNAQQMAIDTVSNNLSNVNSVGFKKTTVGFQDLWYQANSGETSLLGLPQTSATFNLGTGACPAVTQKVFSQGSLEQTKNPLDLAIEGKGFFRVMLGDGSYAYTREGTLRMNAQGDKLVTAAGYSLDPSITIPSGATSIGISNQGVVTAILEGEDAPTEIGRIKLFKFINPSGLSASGESLFTETVASGGTTEGTPGSNGFGHLAQGFVESSNVNMVEEMVKLIVAQRAYQINSRAVRNVDEMLSIANSIRG
jgi:flagellar basal-body rod protein FlgG